MDNKQIIKNNKLIAEFMGWKWELKNHFGINILQCPKGNGYSPKALKFYESWDWLMPVVEKIESMGYFVKISTKMCAILRDNKGNNDSYLIQSIFGDKTKFEKLYDCVISFIKYSNKSNK